MSKKQRRSFTDEYKREAALLVIDTGRAVAAVAQEIHFGEQTPGRSVKLEKARRGPVIRGSRWTKKIELSCSDYAKKTLISNKIICSWEKQPSSRRSDKSRTVRIDGSGEGELPGISHGPVIRSLTVGVLWVAVAPADWAESTGCPAACLGRSRSCSLRGFRGCLNANQLCTMLASARHP